MGLYLDPSQNKENLFLSPAAGQKSLTEVLSEGIKEVVASAHQYLASKADLEKTKEKIKKIDDTCDMVAVSLARSAALKAKVAARQAARQAGLTPPNPTN